MRRATNTTRANSLNRFKFRRDLLPSADDYFNAQNVTLNGRGEWKSALCPFHEDSNPSLRINSHSGGFRCMTCGAHGGDVLSFHQQRYGQSFVEAAKALGAWGAT